MTQTLRIYNHKKKTDQKMVLLNNKSTLQETINKKNGPKNSLTT